MALNFPSSPTNGQVFSYGDRTWIYSTGKGWIASVSANVFSEVSDTPSANQNDYNPSGFSTTTTQLRLNIGASIKLTGLSAGASGQTVTIVNASTDFLLWLENENPSSAAANRFKLPKGFPAFLMPGDTITLRYGATSSRWRVVEWASQGPAMGLAEFDDFIGGSASGNTVSVGAWAQCFSGTGSGASQTPYALNTTEKPLGSLAVASGTTTTGRAHFSTPQANMLWGQGAMLLVARIAVQTAVDGTQTFTVRSGITDGGVNGSPQNGCTWEYRWNGSAAEWSQTSFSGGVATRSTTGSPSTSTNYIWLVCFVNADGSRVDMIYSDDSVSFTKASSISSGLPAAGTTTGMEAIGIVKSAGTTSRLASIDLAGYRVDGVRG